MAAIDRIEGRIAFLRAELKITESQASAWNAFADALRTNSQKLGQVRASMTPQPGSANSKLRPWPSVSICRSDGFLHGLKAPGR